MEVTWINGTIPPPKTGEYYIAIRAKTEYSLGGLKKGDIHIDGDWYDVEDGEWQTIGKNNPIWEVIGWARLLKPDIPKEWQKDVTNFFGMEIEKGE